MNREAVENKIWKALDGTKRSDFEKEQIVASICIFADFVIDGFLEEKVYNKEKQRRDSIC